MVGTIKIAARLHDGTIRADARWTLDMFELFEHIDFFKDDPAHLRNYMVERSDDNTVSPTGNGIILFDAVTHTIYSSNGFFTPGSADVVTVLRRADYSAEYATFWETMMRQGRLSVFDLSGNRIEGFSADSPLSIIDESRRLYRFENDKNILTKVRIDMSPWTVKLFPICFGWDMLDAVQSDGFPLTAADISTWNHWLEELRR